MYRLLLFYFLVIVIIQFILESVYKLLHSKMGIGAPEFDVAYNAAMVLYAQLLSWISLYFSPFLTLFNILILVLTFFMKLVMILILNQ